MKPGAPMAELRRGDKVRDRFTPGPVMVIESLQVTEYPNDKPYFWAVCTWEEEGRPRIRYCGEFELERADG